MTEHWITIDEFPNYEVSNFGNVRNRHSGCILQPWLVNGYEVVRLRNGLVTRNLYIHRLVADAFFDGDHDEFEVNHLDGNKTNNFLGNLEWCTRRENAQHAVRTGLFTPYRLPPHPHECKRVRIVETGEIYDSLTNCAESIGGHKTAISACILGKVKTHKGYHFEHVE